MEEIEKGVCAFNAMDWLKLPTIKLFKRGDAFHTYITSMNHQELLIQLSPRKIIIYDVEKNEILSDIELPSTGYIQDIQSFALKHRTNELYLYSHNQMNCVNLKNMNKSHPITHDHFPRAGATARKYLLLIEDEFHIFADHDCHWIASLKDKKLHVIHNTICGQNHTKMPQQKESNFFGKAVYVSSQKIIILLTTSDIWSYSLKTKLWTRQNIISFAVFCHFDAVLSFNERYIILFGDSFADIFFLDILHFNEWKVFKSRIRCPFNGVSCVVRTENKDLRKNELLVFGYVRMLFGGKAFGHVRLPSDEVIMLIAQKYFGETIHVINGTGEHFGIYLNQILDSPMIVFPEKVD